MRLPRAGGGGDLDQNTQVYIDVHIALELLHMRYPAYIQQTTQDERTLYQLFIALKGLKEEAATRRAQMEAEMEHEVSRATQHGYRH